MSFLKSAGVFVALAISVSAHGHVSGVVSNGQWYAGTTPEWFYHPEKPNTAGWYANNQDNGFIDPTAFGDGDIVCHKGATPGLASIPVTAGESIDIQWNTWPESHHGPVLDYLAPVDGDFADIDKTALQFFKIDEAGLNDESTAPGSWASDDIIANNNTWSVTIPASIAPGKYVLRHELISLHSADHENGAQNYPQCLNIEVASDGTDIPVGEPATSFYKAEDAGIHLSIYTAPVEYTIPGPALYSGAGSSPEKPAKPSSSTSASSPASTISAAGSSVIEASSIVQAPYSNATHSSTAVPTPGVINFTSTTTGAAEEATRYSAEEAVATSSSSSAYSMVQPTNAPTLKTEVAPVHASTSAVHGSAPFETPAPVVTKTPSAYGSKPDKDLPEDFALEDLQQWVAYLLEQGWKKNGRHHARHFAF